MLMRCESCGKLFDYERADGICPGCGQFCQLPRITEALAPETPRPSDRHPGPAAGTAAFDHDGAARPRAQSAGSGWRRAFFVLVFFWACVMAGGSLLLRHQAAGLPERAAFLSPVPDEVNGAFCRHGREIAVTGAEIMGSDYRAGLPEGGCLVRVGLRLDETVWYGNSDELYLQSGGCFYQAADSWYLAQLYPDLAQNALDGSQPQYTGAAEGWLYFALPGPPEDAALYLEQADGYGSDRRVDGAAVCPLEFVPAQMSEPEGGEPDA